MRFIIEGHLQGLLDEPLAEVMDKARAVAQARAHPHLITFSPKIFLPVTRLCRDSCAYCTFAQPPRPRQRAFMTPDEVLAVAHQGADAGCVEALFTLGDKPEAAYPQAREELRTLGFSTTLQYVAYLCERVLRETSLLPHVNCGVADRSALAALKRVSASQGLMLESTAPALCRPGGAHFDCPDKVPAARVTHLEEAGRLGIPMTSGLLVGIGESAADRLRDILLLRDLHARFGHLQELIIQNFVPKPGTAMEHSAPPGKTEHLRTIALARLVFGPDMSIQAPPNLSEQGPGGHAASWSELVAAGINDWGGVSPVTRDYVNPERRWPHLHALADATAATGALLVPRLPVYPRYIEQTAVDSAQWLSMAELKDGDGVPDEVSASAAGMPARRSVASAVLARADATGLLRPSGWYAGLAAPPDGTDELQLQRASCIPKGGDPSGVAGPANGVGTPRPMNPVVPPPSRTRWTVSVSADGGLAGSSEPAQCSSAVTAALTRLACTHEAAQASQRSDVGSVHSTARAEASLPRGSDVLTLLHARGADMRAVVDAADALNRRVHGNAVSYVVNRNINYTNVCTYKCGFCAFSKGRAAESLRGAPYLIGIDEIQRRVAEAWDRGATEVCLQGGIHPDFTGQTYVDILRACKDAAPRVHVHAFSPLEVSHGAETLGVPVPRFLERLRAAGLGSLPGTAAEVLTARVRSVICPDKLTSQEWLDVVGAAHDVGLKTTSTIMFGHVDSPVDWCEHLLRLRALAARTRGITEFVPLPFVHMEAPIFRKGRSRCGPTLHEAVILHAVARLVLFPHIQNIQASWVKMGPAWAGRLLQAGCNDMGGSIMDESITRAAGASHGQELPPSEMEAVIREANRQAWQRTTLYSAAPSRQVERSFAAPALANIM